MAPETARHHASPSATASAKLMPLAGIRTRPKTLARRQRSLAGRGSPQQSDGWACLTSAMAAEPGFCEGHVPVPLGNPRRTFAPGGSVGARHSLNVRASRSWRWPGVMAVGSSVVSHPAGRGAKPLLGFRRQPGRLALAVFRLPLLLYHRGWGWLLGDTFLLLAHAGRKPGSATPPSPWF